MMSASKITLKYTTEDVFNEPKHKRRSARIQNLQNTELDPPELSPKLPNTIDFKNNESGQELFCVSDKRESYAFDTDHTSDRENSEESDESLKSPNKSLQTRFKNSKDKKYFKRYNNAQITPEMGIQTKDVSKVFKMISKPIHTSPQIKSPVKSPLKTYTNPRKCSDKNESIESFGLPDNPLSYPNMPLPQMDQVLDVEILDAKEITIQDLKFVDEPWCIIDLEQHFSNIKEIRIKPDPEDQDKTCYPTKNCTETVNNDFNISLSPQSKLKNRQHRRVVLENSPIEKQLKRLSPNKNILTTSKSKSDKIFANHSLTLEENEVEIFNSRYVQNSFDLTSVKTNRLYPKSPNKKNRNKTLQVTDDEISSQNEIRTLRSSSVSNESEKEITKKQLLKKPKNKNFMYSIDLDKMTVVNDNCVSKRILRSSSCINLHNFEQFEISEPLKKSKSQINLGSDNNLQNTSKNSYLDINKVKNAIQDKHKPKKEHVRELKITLCPLPLKLKDGSIEVKNSQNANKDADISNRNSFQNITTHFIKKNKIPTSCEMTLKRTDISKDSKVSVNFDNKKEKPKFMCGPSQEILFSNENKKSENIKTDNSIENFNVNVSKNEIAHKTNKVSLGSDLHSIQLQQERKLSEGDVETSSLFPKLNYSEERTSKIAAFAKLSECFSRRSYIRKSQSFNVSNSDKSPLKFMKTDVHEKNDSFDSCQMNASFNENAELSDNIMLDILSPSTTSTPNKRLKGRPKKLNKEEFNKINENIQISISDQRGELLATKKQRKNPDNKNYEHDQTNGIVENNKTEADKSSGYEDSNQNQSCIPRIIENEEHKELKREQIEIDRCLALKAVNIKKRDRPKKKVNKEIGNDNRSEITINVEYDKDEPSNSCSKSLRSREINKGKETNLAVIDQVEVDVVDDNVKRRNNSSNKIFHEDYCDDNIIGETKIEETNENCSSYQNCFSKKVSKLLQSKNKTLNNENNHITNNKYNLVTNFEENKQNVEFIDLNDLDDLDDQKNETSHSILDVSDEEVSAINESIIVRKRNPFPLNRIKTSKTSIQSRINKQITDLEAYVPPTRTRSKTNLGDAVNGTDLTLNDGIKKITRSKTSLGKNINELSTDSSFEDDDIIPKRTRSKTSFGKRINEINENLISSPKSSICKINSNGKKNEINSTLKKKNSPNGTKSNKIQLTDTNSDEDVSPRITRYRSHLGEKLCKNDSNQTGNITRTKLNNYKHKGFNKTLPLKETTSKNTNNQEFYSRITRIKSNIGIQISRTDSKDMNIEDIIETVESHKSFPSKITRCKSSLDTRINRTDSAKTIENNVDSLNVAETNNIFSKDETFSPPSTRTNPGLGAGRVCAHIEKTFKEDVSSKNSLNGTAENNALNYNSVFPLKMGNSHGLSESLDMNRIEEDIKQNFDIPENIEYKENIKKISNNAALEEHLYKSEENLEINKIECSLENKILENGNKYIDQNYVDVEDSLKENIEEIMSPLDKTSSSQESSFDEKAINDRNLLDSIEIKNDLGTEIIKNNISSNKEYYSLEGITKGTNEPCVNPNTEDCYVSEINITPKKAGNNYEKNLEIATEEDKIINHDNIKDYSKENLEDALICFPIKTEIENSTNNDAREKGTSFTTISSNNNIKTLISDDLKITCASENTENKITSLILDVTTDNCHRDQTEKAAKLDNSLTVDNCSVDDDNKDQIILNEKQQCNYAVKKRPRGRPRSKSVAPTYRFSASSENRNIINQEDEDSQISPIPKLFKRSHSVGPRQEYAIPDLINPKVGKIAWAQIGHYPFWPCVITEEPKTKNYMKSVIKPYGPRVFYHVKFFGDNGRRAWIYSKKLMNYTNRDDLQKIFDTLKEVKSISLLNAFSVKQNLLKKWTNAVEEVEQVQSHNFNLNQIINYMATTNGQFQYTQEVGISETKLTTKGKKIHKEKIIKKNQLLESDTNVSHIKKKIKLSPSNSPTSPTEKESKKRISKVSEDKKIIIKDEILDIEYHVSEGSIDHFGTYSFDEQRALFKRNNLFKGIPKDKVCQFCFNFGEIFKCRGGCYGIYHLECSVQVLVEKVPKRRTIRSSLKMENAETFEVKIEKKENNSGTQSEVDESHVQIITVPSSVCATPPRKTFPPDVMNMTLADRIDFKMKEIMKKFESTTYLAMLNELSSEENSPSLKTKSFSRCQDLFSVDSQSCSMLDKELDVISKLDQQSPISAKGIEQRLEGILEPSLSKHVTADSPGESTRCSTQNDSSIEKYDQNLIGHVTADSEGLSESISELNTEKIFSDRNNKPNKNRKSLTKHVTADTSSPIENKTPVILPVETKIFNGKLNGARKSLMKHVTADSDGTETIDSESLRSNSSRQSKQSENLEQSELFKNINPKHFKCGFCTEDIDPYCFICHESVSRRESNIRQKCSLKQCSRFYHPECLKLWPQTQWSLIQTTKNRFSKEEVDSFVCPQHVCHTCASDDPHAATSRCSGDKIVKCMCCPASYHSTNLCVPAGTEIITSSQIICPRHRNKSKNNTINTTWCFICNQGGNLICCEICPTSVHPECMTVNLTDDDKFICEDCESGRLPLYDEIVWVKVGQYKWWPGLILFPNEIPPNVFNAKHLPGEFVVKFFGTYDHFWVNRGRSFLFQEGDANETGSSTKSKVQTVFKKAVEEAIVAHKLKKLFKSTQVAESVSTMKPPPYIRIKVSKPVGNVKLMELDLSNTTACECDPSQPNPCGPDSNCLNRLLWTECNPEVCPAGQLCKNQSFEKREYPPLIPYKTEARGWGLKTLASIKKGQFVIEYVGELIDDEEYQRRVIKMHEQKEENYYFLTIHTNRMIDAGPKGNVARFMNHCCQPNCETQKWTVNGGTRVGLFATKEIAAHTELTFNYNLECSGTEKKVCKCGAPNCSGFIGVKAKQETADPKKPKKSYNKKKEPVKAIVLPPCFICQKEGEVGLCNNKICNKAYHLDCLKLEKWPEGTKFVCPRHYCNICSKRTIRCCGKCLNSFCPPHSEGNIRYDDLMGFVCNIHEPTKPDKTTLPIKKKRGTATSEDAIVTSTTNDIDENDLDDVPLVFRQKAKKSKKHSLVETNTVDVGDAHTSLVKESETESQDETVSRATASDFEDELQPKRKKKQLKRKMKNKRRKLKNMKCINEIITANTKIVSLNGSNIAR